MKRNWTYSILIIITSILLLGLNKLADFQKEEQVGNVESSNGGTEGEMTKFYINAAGHEIALWENEGKYYAFIPSACQNKHLDAEIPDDIEPSSIVRMYSENIPAVFIDTESGTSEQINTNKEIKETGHISVLEADGRTSFDYPLTYVKGRGNTSYTEFEKSPIRSSCPNLFLFWECNLQKNGSLSPIPQTLRCFAMHYPEILPRISVCLSRKTAYSWICI